MNTMQIRSNLVQYIAAAIRYANKETGTVIDVREQDLIIVTSDYDPISCISEPIMGMPILTTPMSIGGEPFIIAGCQSYAPSKALKAIHEYMELHPWSYEEEQEKE